jgi:hypothetical protein
VLDLLVVDLVVVIVLFRFAAVVATLEPASLLLACEALGAVGADRTSATSRPSHKASEQ